ncbi:glycerol-3-phosphate dehydrogenase/oxidase [Corynebacterium sp. H78]|uniref:glycerol-3-phosphate dehydrogenase/oxidase n=1 Tax=Corynebacterium sp. H78 TaxID=3133417 RepID=UPI00309D3FB0
MPKHNSQRTLPQSTRPQPTHSSALNASRRNAEWQELKRISASSTVDEQPDLVIIGAGVTGAGIALDAASRGLKTVLVDAHDLAFGTSRWSSKLVHGGLRYLASGNVGIAQRSANERRVLMEKTAPHLVRAIPQVVPVYAGQPLGKALLPRIGFIAGDVLRVLSRTSATTLPRSRTVSAKRVAQLVPGVKNTSLRCGHLNYDGQLIDDARLVVAIARTAASYGAKVLTKVKASDVDGTSLTLTDTLSGETRRLRARQVVNATGVWAGDLAPEIRVRPSRGTHIVVDSAKLGNSSSSLTVPVPGSSSRFCFTLPSQHGRTYIGITDEPLDGPIPDVPATPDSDIDFILGVINQALDTPLTRDDVIGAFSGLRPLIDVISDGDDSPSTADLSRNHALITSENGLISITGGKLTEYRLMAEEVVDAVVKQLSEQSTGQPGRNVADRIQPCLTRDVPLVGAPGGPLAQSQQPMPQNSSQASDIPDSVTARFGTEAAKVISQCPLSRPCDPVAEGVDITRAEFAWHVTHEGALTVEDLVDRRSRIGLVASDRDKVLECAREVLQLTDTK